MIFYVFGVCLKEELRNYCFDSDLVSEYNKESVKKIQSHKIKQINNNIDILQHKDKYFAREKKIQIKFLNKFNCRYN